MFTASSLFLISFYSFELFSTLKFAVIKWFLGETCFIKIFFSLFFFSLDRSSHRRCFANSQKNTCGGAFFNRVASIQACNFIKKRLEHRCFSMKLAKFLRTPTLKNICKWLLLSQTVLFYFYGEKDCL